MEEWAAEGEGKGLDPYISGSLELEGALPGQRGAETLFISRQRC